MYQGCALFLTIIYFVHAVNVIISTSDGTTGEGYYWRDLIGDAPEDAIRGGTDSKGKPTYIGQTVHFAGAGSLLTGSYVPSEKKFYYEFGNQQWIVENNIKILCSQEPDSFKWLNVREGEAVERGKQISYVRGGFDSAAGQLGVGRIAFGEEVVLGKVLIVNNVFKRMYYNKNGAGTSTAEYEVLYYESEKKRGCSARAPVTITIN